MRKLIAWFRNWGKDRNAAEIEKALNACIDEAFGPQTNAAVPPTRLEVEQAQRESYTLYEGGRHRCVVFGTDRLGLQVDRSRIELDGFKARQRAQRRADQVAKGLRAHRVESMDEKAIADAIDVYKQAPLELPEVSGKKTEGP